MGGGGRARDEDAAGLGVRVEDKADGGSTWKREDPAVLARERREAAARAASARAAKLSKQLQARQAVRSSVPSEALPRSQVAAVPAAWPPNCAAVMVGTLSLSYGLLRISSSSALWFPILAYLRDEDAEVAPGGPKLWRGLAVPPRHLPLHAGARQAGGGGEETGTAGRAGRQIRLARLERQGGRPNARRGAPRGRVHAGRPPV